MEKTPKSAEKYGPPLPHSLKITGAEDGVGSLNQRLKHGENTKARRKNAPRLAPHGTKPVKAFRMCDSRSLLTKTFLQGEAKCDFRNLPTKNNPQPPRPLARIHHAGPQPENVYKQIFDDEILTSEEKAQSAIIRPKKPRIFRENETPSFQKPRKRTFPLCYTGGKNSTKVAAASCRLTEKSGKMPLLL